MDVRITKFGYQSAFPAEIVLGSTVHTGVVSHVEEHLYKWRGSKAKLIGIDWRCHLKDGGIVYLREMYVGKKSAWTLLRRKYAKRGKKRQIKS